MRCSSISLFFDFFLYSLSVKYGLPYFTDRTNSTEIILFILSDILFEPIPTVKIINFAICCCYCSITKLCPTLWDPWTAICQSPLSFTIFQSLISFMSIDLVMLSNHLILCLPLLLLLSAYPSIKVFSSESALRIRLPKYWNCSISRSNEYLELIFLGFTGLISWPSKELSRVFSSTTVWKHQFFSAQPSLWANIHIHTWLLEKP